MLRTRRRAAKRYSEVTTYLEVLLNLGCGHERWDRIKSGAGWVEVGRRAQGDGRAPVLRGLEVEGVREMYI